MPSSLLLSCKIKNLYNMSENIKYNFRCNKNLMNEINQNYSKIYKPLYIPVLTLMCCFLIIVPKNHISYKEIKKFFNNFFDYHYV